MVSITAKVQSIDDVVKIFIDENLSPEAQSAAFAAFAEEQLSEAEDTDQYIFGRVPPHETVVDGVVGAAEENVRPNGTIVYNFSLVSDVLVYIADQLTVNSPVGGPGDPHPGLYQHHHILFADGTQVTADEEVPDAQIYLFADAEPYSRKIEKRNGVYQAVATVAQQQFGTIAKIEYGWTSIMGGKTDLAGWAATTKLTHRASDRAEWLTRQPSITVTVK